MGGQENGQRLTALLLPADTLLEGFARVAALQRGQRAVGIAGQPESAAKMLAARRSRLNCMCACASKQEAGSWPTPLSRGCWPPLAASACVPFLLACASHRSAVCSAVAEVDLAACRRPGFQGPPGLSPPGVPAERSDKRAAPSPVQRGWQLVCRHSLTTGCAAPRGPHQPLSQLPSQLPQPALHAMHWPLTHTVLLPQTLQRGVALCVRLCRGMHGHGGVGWVGWGWE